ncbi:MAG: anti-sigma factor [Chloroflexota bacterium]|nr:anti-sigma factor [Chloroflexota bacterium]
MSNWLSMNPPESDDICLAIDDLIEGFSIGALDPDEMLRVADALDSCPEQAARLADLEGTVGLLGLSLEPVRPSPALWDRIAASTSPAVEPVSIESHRVRRTIAVPQWAAALVAAAAIVLLISTISLGYALREADDDGAMDDFESAMTSYMTSGGTMMTLSSWAAPEYMTWPGKGTLLMAPDMPPMIFVDDCIPTESNNVEYYVWLEKGGERTPMGLMEIDEDGKGMIQLEGVDSLYEYDAIGISIKTENNTVYDLMEGWPSDDSGAEQG